MIRIQYTLTALALAATACSSPAPETAAPAAAPSTVPSEIAAAATAAAPGITITNGEAGDDEYEVTGTMPNGDEVELDMVRSNGAWTVQEVQRDVAWASVPEPVRAAAAAAPNPFEPVRVIESRQTADGAVVYELFRTAQQGGGGPAIEVRWHEGKAAVITPAP